MGGLAAAKRGECDVAGIHLMDAATGEYNRHLMTDALDAARRLRPHAGHRSSPRRRALRRQRRRGSARRRARDPECAMVNRNTGSGTRIVIDKLLGRAPAPGYAVQVKSHNAVAARRAAAARRLGRRDRTPSPTSTARLHRAAAGAIRLRRAHARLARSAVRMFRELLDDAEIRERLRALGFDA
jgi:putative molybdopterin biosynthesis protein